MNMFYMSGDSLLAYDLRMFGLQLRVLGKIE